MTASIEAPVIIVLKDSHFKLKGRTNILNFGGNTQKRMAIRKFTRKIFGLFKGNMSCSMYSYKQKNICIFYKLLSGPAGFSQQGTLTVNNTIPLCMYGLVELQSY